MDLRRLLIDNGAGGPGMRSPFPIVLALVLAPASAPAHPRVLLGTCGAKETVLASTSWLDAVTAYTLLQQFGGAKGGKVPAGDTRLPMAAGDPMVLVTPSGMVTTAATGFSITAGSPVPRFRVHAPGLGANGAAECLAILGSKAPDGTRLARPGPGHPEGRDRAVLRGFRWEIGKRLPPKSKDRLHEHPDILNPKNVRLWQARLPEGIGFLAAASAAVSDKWGLAALAFVDRGGAVQQWLEHPRTLVTVTWEVPWAVDLDGDGIDEVLLRTRFPDGRDAIELLRWNGKKFERSSLGAGD